MFKRLTSIASFTSSITICLLRDTVGRCQEDIRGFICSYSEYTSKMLAHAWASSILSTSRVISSTYNQPTQSIIKPDDSLALTLTFVCRSYTVKWREESSSIRHLDNVVTNIGGLFSFFVLRILSTPELSTKARNFFRRANMSIITPDVCFMRTYP